MRCWSTTASGTRAETGQLRGTCPSRRSRRLTVTGSPRPPARLGGAQELEALMAGSLFPDSDMGWVVLSLGPDAPGELLIDEATLTSVQAELLGTRPTVVPTALSWTNVHVGRRYLLVSDAVADHTGPRQLAAILCHDGAGVFAMNPAESRPVVHVPAPSFAPPPRPRWRRRDRPGPLRAPASPEEGQADRRRAPGTLLHDEQVVNAILTGLRFLGRHARDRAATSGSALVRVHVHAPRSQVNLGTGGRAESDSMWMRTGWSSQRSLLHRSMPWPLTGQIS